MHHQPSAQTIILHYWQHIPTSSLQEAAGYFRLLHDVVAPQLDEVPSFDISTGCTEMLELLMLAQAQEAFFQKASRDKKNPAVLARYAYPHIMQPSKHGHVEGSNLLLSKLMYYHRRQFNNTKSVISSYLWASDSTVSEPQHAAAQAV